MRLTECLFSAALHGLHFHALLLTPHTTLCNDVMVTVYRRRACCQSLTSKKTWDLNLLLLDSEVYPVLF